MSYDLSQTQATWDQAAPAFDHEPDHGLRDPATRAAWAERLRQWLPANSCHILDVGCGTGSLSVLAAEMGHTVVGIDCSPEMLKLAQAKARTCGVSVTFAQMNAAQPTLGDQRFDVLMCRHLLWALPQPPAVLRRWAEDLLAITGRLLLIEGFWATGSGLHAQEIMTMLPPHLNDVQQIDLSQQDILWGKSVSDERYAITATRRWFHGSPEVLSVIKAGSSITPTENIARAFSHKPELLSIDDDGTVIHHNGTRAGYLYTLNEMLSADDVVIHSASPDAPWFEWLVKRPVSVNLLHETHVLDAERLSEKEIAKLRTRQENTQGNSFEQRDTP